MHKQKKNEREEEERKLLRNLGRRGRILVKEGCLYLVIIFDSKCIIHVDEDSLSKS